MTIDVPYNDDYVYHTFDFIYDLVLHALSYAMHGFFVRRMCRAIEVLSVYIALLTLSLRS
jgi:hypothetical protein